jgi:hypothetical protein
MDAGFFRVSRSAGLWGEMRSFSVRPIRKPKLWTRWLAEGGFGDLLRIPGTGGRFSPPPLRCGGDRCDPAQSPPPGSSPIRGGGGRKMAAGTGRSGTWLPAFLGLRARCRACRRVLGPSGAGRRKSPGGGRREARGDWRQEGTESTVRGYAPGERLGERGV